MRCPILFNKCTEEFGGNKVDLAAMTAQQVLHSSKKLILKKIIKITKPFADIFDKLWI